VRGTDSAGHLNRPGRSGSARLRDVPTEHIVSAGVLLRDGLVLLGYRSATKDRYPSVWDFPGGHVEPGESSEAALVRELWEELAVTVSVPTRPADLQVVDDELSLSVWVDAFEGEPVNAAPDEHDEIAWFDADDLSSLHLADPAYRPFLQRLTSGA
jgi:8-oxo-dGTP diphosphatase